MATTTDALKSTASSGAFSLSSVTAALKDGGFAGLVTLGLSFPIVALRAEQDMSNQLILQQRWSWSLIAAAAVFAVRFLVVLVRGRPRTVAAGIPIPALPRPAVAPSRASVLFTRYIGV
ncbi:MAG: DUF3382 domain-containing protein, partial [Methylobacteriaceae bacterium]|nr:DUF3382 domain-containing protein [Methylobacteriaceae bacterium]